jgi:hypothetical protein
MLYTWILDYIAQQRYRSLYEIYLATDKNKSFFQHCMKCF